MTQSSVILSFLSLVYSRSFFKRLLESISSFIFGICSTSRILEYLRSTSLSVNKRYDESRFFYFFNVLINLPLVVLKKIYFTMGESFESGFTFQALRFCLRRFDILISSFIFIIIVVPDNYWNNMYSLAFAFVLYSGFIVRAVVFNHKGFDVRKLGFFLTLFFLVVTLSFLTSVYPALSLRFFLFNLTCFLYLLLIVDAIKTNKALETVVATFSLGVFLIAIFGIWQVITDSVPFDPSLTDASVNFGLPGRVFSTMSNPNNFAQVLVMVFPFVLAMFFYYKNYFLKSQYFIYLIAILIAITFTGSRSGWIGLAVGTFFFLLFKKPFLVPLIILLLLASTPFLPNFLIRRVLTLTNIAADSSISYREQIYDTFLPMIRDFWFTGIGLGTDVFMRVGERYHQYTTKMPMHTHILYTQVLIEMGVIGLGAFLLTVVKSIKDAIVMFFAVDDEFLKNVFLAGASSVLSILVISLVEYVWYYPRVMVVFWFVVGVILATLEINRSKKLKLLKPD